MAEGPSFIASVQRSQDHPISVPRATVLPPRLPIETTARAARLAKAKYLAAATALPIATSHPHRRGNRWTLALAAREDRRADQSAIRPTTNATISSQSMSPYALASGLRNSSATSMRLSSPADRGCCRRWVWCWRCSPQTVIADCARDQLPRLCPRFVGELCQTAAGEEKPKIAGCKP